MDFNVGDEIKFHRLECLSDEERELYDYSEQRFAVVGVSATPHGLLGSLSGVYHHQSVTIMFRDERRSFSGAWFDPERASRISKLID